jgi:hypothetical protein
MRMLGMAKRKVGRLEMGWQVGEGVPCADSDV